MKKSIIYIPQPSSINISATAQLKGKKPSFANKNINASNYVNMLNVRLSDKKTEYEYISWCFMGFIYGNQTNNSSSWSFDVHIYNSLMKESKNIHFRKKKRQDCNFLKHCSNSKSMNSPIKTWYYRSTKKTEKF